MKNQVSQASHTKCTIHTTIFMHFLILASNHPNDANTCCLWHFFFCTPCEHTRVTRNTPLAVTCSVCYPCLGSVCPPGTAPSAGGTPPSLLHGLHGNALHGPPRLSPLVTLPTQVTASAHKTGATDAAALDIAALRNRAVRAAATGQTLLTLGIPPAVRLDQSQHRGVKGYRAMRTRHLAT